MWKPEPRQVPECIEGLGLASGKVPSTSGMKGLVKTLANAEDKPEKVESKELQRLTSYKMFFRSLDDSTLQLEGNGCSWSA